MSSFDFTIASGAEIPIEQRDENEVLTFAGQRVAANGSHAYNPSFDVTPNELLTGIVTDRGVFRPPFGKWEQP